MSANLHVDIANTALFVPSIVSNTSPGSGALFGLSGGIVGQWVDLSNTDTFCNVWVAVGACSGPLQVAVQTAYGPYDQQGVLAGSGSVSGNIFSGGAPLSGSFTDPTSGLAQLPTWFSSGGVLILNSGLYTTPGQQGASGQLVNGYPIGTLPFGPNPVQNGMGGTGFTGSGATPVFASGGIAYAGFQRNAQYARLVLLSGATAYPCIIGGFIAQSDTTGSGGGFSFQPLGGAVKV